MKPKIATFLSYLFHPLLAPTLFFAFLFIASPELFVFTYKIKLYILALIFLFTGIFPSISLAFLYTNAFVNTLKFENKPDRLIQLTIATVYYTMLAYVFVDKVAISDLLTTLIVSISLTLAFTTMLSVFKKTSLHVTSISGALGLVFALQLNFPENNLLLPLILMILITGTVTSARMSLHETSPIQAIMGFFMGFGICLVSALYLF